MEETDAKIKVMSSVQEEERASVYNKLMEHLGGCQMCVCERKSRFSQQKEKHPHVQT